MSSTSQKTAALQKIEFKNELQFALSLDKSDELAEFRKQFLIPKTKDGKEWIYMAGNSLGLQPIKVREYIGEELDDWAIHGVEGHWDAKHPWLPYHENLTEMAARLVGAKPVEVVIMNTLTVNLHLMMVSFYRPTKERYKIIIEADAFPSDKYAVDSQACFHGFDPQSAVVALRPRDGEFTLRHEDIMQAIEKEGQSLALVMLGNVSYLTGQAFDMKSIAAKAHSVGAQAGFNLAHGAGNLHLKLHDDDVDFAVWCSYKYLNSGPGSLAGCFVHERHSKDFSLPRFAGWWGHDKKTRFQMGPQFAPIPGAEGWQLSNPPIFQLAALRASMELFDKAGMAKLRQKGDLLTGYLEFLLSQIGGDFFKVITPQDVSQRGSQLSIKLKSQPKDFVKLLREKGVICDFREPDIMRAAPAPLYNSFEDVYHFAKTVGEHVS
ncbi:MAG: kynureninase [Candidatus Melainabacteria bacterium]|jgi:kynureninase|nr:kynureninase [Candidatus Melainabacteria bacterium]